jgi:hypothetical protein
MRLPFEDYLQLMSDRNVPYVLVDGAIDEPATVRQVLTALGMRESEPPCKEVIYTWDCVSGLEISAASVDVKEADDLFKKLEVNPSRLDLQDPLVALKVVANVANEWKDGNPKGYGAAFVFFTGDRVLSEKAEDHLKIMQLMMNMRDDLSDARVMGVFVGIEFNVPPELKEHVKLIQAPMPSREEINSLIDAAYGSYQEGYDSRKGEPKYELTEDDRLAFTEAVKGVSSFQVNQNLFLAMDNAGIHVERLRENTIQTINKTKGLSVVKPKINGFSGLGGLYSLKEYMTALMNGRLRPKTLLFVDEIEKAVSGSGGSGGSDTSGVSGNMLGTVLTEMVETRALGLLTTGVYGCGKSAFAEAFGVEAGAITIHLDLAGMKDSLVGSSEANLRQALKVIRAIGDDEGGILWIATCNRIEHLAPELKSRFNLGTYFFDLPKQEERAVIWDIHLRKYFPEQYAQSSEPFDHGALGFDDTDWSGREIEACCRLAWLMNCDLATAAKRVTPVAMTARDEIQSLRREAENTFLDATFEGLYQMNRVAPRSAKPVTKPTHNKVTL